MAPDLYLYDGFEPGIQIGTHVEVYEESLSRRWREIFEPSQPMAPAAPASAEPAGIAVAMMMRSYLGVVTPRPPGNVHARQRMSFSALPVHGEVVRTVVSCAGKELRRGRRYVELDVLATGHLDRPLFSGRLTLVWAA